MAMVQRRLVGARRVALLLAALGRVLCATLCQAQELAEPPSPHPRPAPASEAGPEDDVLNMDLEQLTRADVVVPAMDTVVTTVSRQESTVGRSPTAVFVITSEMIRRSAARTIPDVLRMAPGVQVARIDANKWAISIRGFNRRLSNKLLVQIDGRTVYAQSFSGVFWDMHDLVLEDIERIEVIRGPGATVWGANAVNGVINIITKRAEDTQGLLAVGGTGTEERGFSTLRYGGELGDDLHWRIYGKQFERDGGYFPGGSFDDWRQWRTGFRADWTPTECDTVTLQGDLFEGESGTFQIAPSASPPFATNLISDTVNRGQNYLLRWTCAYDDNSDWSLQAYYDEWDRKEPLATNAQKTFDVDFQRRLPVGSRHNVIMGAGFRDIDDRIVFLSAQGSVDPPVLSTELYSCFVQDEITVAEDRLYLTVGSKFEHNAFTGFEYQPSVRLLHLPSERESTWFSVSRAVRVPNRLEQHGTFDSLVSPSGPVFGRLSGSPALGAEDVLAVECGYRAQPSDSVSWDLATFYNNYTNLINSSPSGAPFFDPELGAVVVPVMNTNSLSADSYGAELSTVCHLNPEWRVTGAYSLLYVNVHGASSTAIEGASPHNQVYIRSSWDPRPDVESILLVAMWTTCPRSGCPAI